MRMMYLIITIVVIGVILFVVSFFMDDKVEQLKEQFEQFSITTMQDTYQIKKKIKILEEELLTENVVNVSESKETKTSALPDNENIKPLVIQKVYHLHQQGYSNEDISKQTDLTENDIQTILTNHI